MGLLMSIAAVLLVLWVAGLVLHLAGPLIHLALLVAAVLFVAGMFTGRRTSI